MEFDVNYIYLDLFPYSNRRKVSHIVPWHFDLTGAEPPLRWSQTPGQWLVSSGPALVFWKKNGFPPTQIHWLFWYEYQNKKCWSFLIRKERLWSEDSFHSLMFGKANLTSHWKPPGYIKLVVLPSESRSFYNYIVSFVPCNVLMLHTFYLPVRSHFH